MIHFGTDFSFITGKMKEGHYKLHFGDNVTIDQIYVLPECVTPNRNEPCTRNNDYTSHQQTYEVQKLKLNWCSKKESNTIAEIGPKPAKHNGSFEYDIKNDTLSVSIEQQYLDNDFRKCYHYHTINNGHAEELEIKIKCKIGAFKRTNDTVACTEHTMSLIDSIPCNYVENGFINALTFDFMNSSNIGHWKVEAKTELILNLICVMEQPKRESGKRWTKTLFIQQFLINHPYGLDSSEDSEIPRVSLDSEDSSHIAKTLGGVFSLILVFTVFVCFYRQVKIKIKNLAVFQRFITNNLVDSKRISNDYPADYFIGNRSYEILPTQGMTQPIVSDNEEDQNTDNLRECADCNMFSELPDSISQLPDMLYPRCSVDIEEKLGHGNFGSVLKGYLKMGKAR